MNLLCLGGFIVPCNCPMGGEPPFAASDQLVIGGEQGEILEGEAGEELGQERP